MCDKEEGRGRHKNPVFQHFFSPKVGQRNHLSPEYISVTRAKTRNGHWWQIYSSRFLTFVSCPEQGQLCAALCPTHSWEREGMERKPGTVFLGHVQCCFAVSCHIMAIRDSAKAETLRREEICTIAPAKAAGGACLESVNTTGRKGLPRVYTNAERPLRGGKAVRDTLCSWTGGHNGYGPLHVCSSCFPKCRSQRQTSANTSAGTESPVGQKWHRAGCSQ